MSILRVLGGPSNEVSPLISEIELSDVGGGGRHGRRSVDGNVDVVGTIRPPREDRCKFSNTTGVRCGCAPKEIAVIA
jgi:hypothetical protein